MEFADQYAKTRGLSGARVTAHPRPVSPFNWTVFVSDDELHRFAHINLARKEPRPYRPGDGFIARLQAPYLPLEQAIWVTRPRYGYPPTHELVKHAWESPPLAFFREFADLPAFDGFSKGSVSVCAGFVDLRFLTPGRDTMPFRFGACRDQDLTWRLSPPP